MNDYQILTRKPALESRRRLQCEWCRDGSQSETEMFIHRSVLHKDKISALKEKPHVCLMEDSNAAHPCLKVIRNKEEMLRHYKRDHFLSSEHGCRIDREIFVCDLCNQLFFNKNLLALHLVAKHKKIQKHHKFDCPKCGRSVQQNALWSHFEHHSMHCVTTCPICLTRAADRQDLRNHLTTHPRYYRCEMCTYVTNKYDLFYHHIDKYKLKDKKAAILYTTWEEDKISRYFMPKKKIAQKKNNMWYKGLIVNGVNVCIMCREICVDMDDMKRHMEEHNLKQEQVRQSHVCACGEEFTNKILLKQHCFRNKGEHVAVGE